MDKKHYDELFDRLLKGRLSPEETDELLQWLQREDINPEVSDSVRQALLQPVTDQDITPEIKGALAARLPLVLAAGATRHSFPARVFRQSWFRYAAAAVFIGALGFSIYNFLLTSRQTSAPVQPAVAATTDIAPGREGAILTLGDGRQVLLDSLGNGTIISSEGTDVKLNNGQLVYDNTSAETAVASYNTITTPKGRFFQVVLPDQTKVWLNAASSLRYPTAFTGNERQVEVNGEAYFEVAKNPEMPFIVKVNDHTSVRVLGTHFNVNAYTNDDEIKTTLLEGSVELKNNTNSATLRPGQQAKVSHLANGQVKIAASVNLENVMAWKNGVFNFEDASLEEVMHQLERWYDIEVVYEKDIPKIEFVGKMGRDLSLKSVLRGLELSKVHFKLEGRRVLVLP